MNAFLDLQATVANWMLSAQAAGVAPYRNSMMAESPFTDYTAGVVLYVIAVGFLVTALLIGGLLVVNIGMMSKREEDHLGGRTPSDVGILKDELWPDELELTAILPAEDEGQGGEGIAANFGSKQPPSHNVYTRVDVPAERRKREDWTRRREVVEADRLDKAWEQDEIVRRGRSEKPPGEPGQAA